MRALAVVGTSSTYDILTVFARELVAGWTAAGGRAEFLPGDGSLTIDGIGTRLTAGCFDAIAVFNGGALPSTRWGDRPMLERIGVPFWSLMLDPWWHHVPRFAEAVPQRRWTWVDPAHAQLAESAHGGVHRVLPHAGYAAAAPAGERDIPCLMLGGFQDPEDILAGLAASGAAHEAFARDCLAAWQRGGGDPYALILAAHAQRRHAVAQDQSLFDVESLLRAHARTAVARALIARGAKPLCVGRGARTCRALAGAQVQDAVDFPQALALMSRARVVVDAGPLFPAGTHERVLSALRCGAAVVTARSRAWEALPAGSIVTYDAHRPDTAASQALGLIRDRRRCATQAESGRAAAEAAWTPMHQAQRLEAVMAGA